MHMINLMFNEIYEGKFIPSSELNVFKKCFFFPV